MANTVTTAPQSAKAFVDVTSRYINSSVIIYGNNSLVTFETYKRQPIVKTSNDQFYLITQATQYRPDLVSNLAYGVTSYWWRIMEANSLKDITDFKSGLTIRIPKSLF